MDAPPHVGTIAPDFELPDSVGKLWRLSVQAAAFGRVALLFYRGYW
jgi:peroxiredoxin